MSAQQRWGRNPDAAPGRAPTDLDPEVLAGAQRRELEAFEALYRASVGRVLALCTRLCGAERADDMVQEVFLRVWERIDRFEGRSSFFTWLHRLTVNRVTDMLRAEIRREGRELHSEDDAVLLSIPMPERSRRVEALDLERAMSKLPAGARVVFVLHDVEGFRHDEIAETLGIAVGTSKAQLHRARRLLRAHLSI